MPISDLRPTGSVSGGGTVGSVNGQTGTVVLTKTDIGLGNVDNVSSAIVGNIRVNASQPEVVGVQYQTYAAAAAWIQANHTINYGNRWFVSQSGPSSENIVLEQYIYYGAKNQDAPLYGTITTGSATQSGSYLVSDILLTSVDVAAGATLEMKNCIVNAQQNATGTGTLWMRGGRMYSAGGVARTFAFNNFEMTEGAQVLCGGDAPKYSVRGGCYLTIVGSVNVGILNLYDGGATVTLMDGTTLTLDQMYCYGGTFFGSGYGFGTNPKVVINNTASYPSEMMNSVAYGVDVEIDGAGNILKFFANSKGSNAGTESFTAVNGGVLQMEGVVFEDAAFSATNTVDAIKEIRGTQTIPVKFEKTLTALDITNSYVDLASEIHPMSTEDVEVVGAPDGFRHGVDYTVLTNNRIDWSVGGSLLDANLAVGDILIVQYERLI